MVAKIAIVKGASGPLNYNEHKVRQGKATCLAATNVSGEVGELNFYEKLEIFENLNVLNDRANTDTLHLSLNFSPSERLSDSRLVEIANDYMDRIGFGEQPYLVYRHEDAGHPHMHIVSTIIKENGRRINTHNIGKNQSEKARKEIEKLYGLVKAEDQKNLRQADITSLDPEKIVYGLHETKQGISNVVTAVFKQYQFTSLPEFNAALKQFNVMADRGKEGSRIYDKQGLMYRVLDKNGNKMGVPIKASSIACKPILKNLEEKFIANQAGRDLQKQKTKLTIDECLQKTPENLKNFIMLLEEKKIYTLVRQNTEGRIYGITFVDNQNKCVFNGSDLGKEYSVAGLQLKLSQQPPIFSQSIKASRENPSQASDREKAFRQSFETNRHFTNVKTDNLLDILLSSKQQYEPSPSGLLKRRKKKRKVNKEYKL